MINTNEDVHIGCTLVWGYEQKGSYVSCSHEVVMSGRFIRVGVHACWTKSREICRGWTTSGEIRRVGL